MSTRKPESSLKNCIWLNLTILGRGLCNFGIRKATEWTAMPNIDIIEAEIIHGIVELRKIP